MKQKMASPDLMFLIEFAIEELKSFSKARNYKIKARFGSIFTIKLKDPNELLAEALAPRRGCKKANRKIKFRQGRVVPPKSISSIQTAIIVSDIQSLITSMLSNPIEIILYSKDDPFVLGVAEIPWPSTYIEFLKKLELNPDLDLPPVSFCDKYKTYDEYTSKHVAAIKLKLQISRLHYDEKITQIQKNEIAGHIENKLPGTVNTINTVYETGTIKTIYRGGKKFKLNHGHNKKLDKQNDDTKDGIKDDNQNHVEGVNEEKNKQESDITFNNTCKDVVRYRANNFSTSSNSSNRSISFGDKNNGSLATLIRSETRLVKNSLFAITKHWSSTSVEIKERLETLNYIFGNIDGPFGNKVYCVGYFTVENTGFGAGGPSDNSTPTLTPTPTPTGTSSPTAKSSPNTGKSSPTGRSSPPGKGSPLDSSGKTSKAGSSQAAHGVYDGNKSTVSICKPECPFGKGNRCFEEVCTLDLPHSAQKIIEMRKCDNTACYHKKRLPCMTDTPDPILVDFSTSAAAEDCCVQKVEQVVGKVAAQIIKDPCSCTCECKFGFIRKTTYCKVCGGFEVAGDEMKSTRGGQPFPCPIYHGIVKSKKLPRSKDSGSGKKSVAGTGTLGTDEKEKEKDKEAVVKKRKRDPRFKFNYGYKGIPAQIGHSQCALPCSGDLNPVPKSMGWLWTATNIPGMKSRPNWKPGAANKYVVRMLRMARFPEEVMARRRRKDTGKKKRPLKRPLLTVQKKDGEYHITMETVKKFLKPRLVNQYPYEDKPLVCYKVGRTDEENAERAKRKARAERRLEREQRAFLKSAFQDMCKDICLKTYEQALGLLPFGDDSFCPCFPEDPPPHRIDSSHSCSCTDSERSSGSKTDDDEWIVEFTPPSAYFNPASTVKKINSVDTGSQYSYLDYRVKLLDRFGVEVPRFFIGPDGTKQCSDLGGFWGPDNKWLEINYDGVIGPDGRWAPNAFIGPCGEQVDTEDGRFQATNGVWLTIGIDGYVDKNGKWCFYTKSKTEKDKDPRKQRNVEQWTKAGGCKGNQEKKIIPNRFAGGGDRRKQSEGAWSCFGDVTPRTLSQMGIAGHGHDRRLLLSTLEQLIKQGENVKIPQSFDIPKSGAKHRRSRRKFEEIYAEQVKCRHRRVEGRNIFAVNDRGHKIYFQLRDYKNPRPKQRMQVLDEGGISVSSFHVPCLSSFISSEMMRQQKLQHILKHNARVMNATVQTGH